MMPFFSIITATYNAGNALPFLLESLAKQTFQGFELVLQDGASKDNTVTVAESFRDRLPALELQSEPDSGIYDAWNRAVSRARGKWLIFLGADDALVEPDTLAKAQSILEKTSETVLFAAGIGHLVLPGSGAVYAELPVRLEESRTLFEVGCPVCHPSLFYSRNLFAADRFDTQYKVAADYDFLLAHWQEEHIIPLPFVVTKMQIGGVSTTAASRWLTAKETLIIAKKRMGYYPRRLLTLAAKSLLHLAINTILGEERGNRFYDVLRRLSGRDAYWSRQNGS